MSSYKIQVKATCQNARYASLVARRLEHFLISGQDFDVSEDDDVVVATLTTRMEMEPYEIEPLVERIHRVAFDALRRYVPVEVTIVDEEPEKCYAFTEDEVRRLNVEEMTDYEVTSTRTRICTVLASSPDQAKKLADHVPRRRCQIQTSTTAKEVK